MGNSNPYPKGTTTVTAEYTAPATHKALEFMLEEIQNQKRRADNIKRDYKDLKKQVRGGRADKKGDDKVKKPDGKKKEGDKKPVKPKDAKPEPRKVVQHAIDLAAITDSDRYEIGEELTAEAEASSSSDEDEQDESAEE